MIDDNLQAVALAELVEAHLGDVVAYETWVITDGEGVLHLLATLYRPDESLILNVVRLLPVSLCGLIQIPDVGYTLLTLVHPEVVLTAVGYCFSFGVHYVKH